MDPNGEDLTNRQGDHYEVRKDFVAAEQRGVCILFGAGEKPTPSYPGDRQRRLCPAGQGGSMCSLARSANCTEEQKVEMRQFMPATAEFRLCRDQFVQSDLSWRAVITRLGNKCSYEEYLKWQGQFLDATPADYRSEFRKKEGYDGEVCVFEAAEWDYTEQDLLKGEMPLSSVQVLFTWQDSTFILMSVPGQEGATYRLFELTNGKQKLVAQYYDYHWGG